SREKARGRDAPECGRRSLYVSRPLVRKHLNLSEGLKDVPAPPARSVEPERLVPPARLAASALGRAYVRADALMVLPDEVRRSSRSRCCRTVPGSSGA